MYSRFSCHLKPNKIVIHYTKRKLPLVSTQPLETLNSTWYSTLRRAGEGRRQTSSPVVLHYTCRPRNLVAIWWGTSLSPCTSGTLVYRSHRARKTDACNIKESTPTRIDQTATGARLQQSWLISANEKLLFNLLHWVVLVCGRSHPLTKQAPTDGRTIETLCAFADIKTKEENHVMILETHQLLENVNLTLINP